MKSSSKNFGRMLSGGAAMAALASAAFQATASAFKLGKAINDIPPTHKGRVGPQFTPQVFMPSHQTKKRGLRLKFIGMAKKPAIHHFNKRKKPFIRGVPIAIGTYVPTGRSWPKGCHRSKAERRALAA